jgi:hypothetical protein
MHFIHLGRVGLVIDLRWGEIANFFAGLATLDFANNSDPDSGHIQNTESPDVELR